MSDLLVTALLLLTIAVLRRLEERVIKYIDEAQQTAQDYAVS